jgi:hypothetical protein
LNQAQTVADTISGDNRLQEPGRQFKTVQGRTFYASAGVWTDAGIQGTAKLPVVRIAFAANEYFTLLKKQPELAPLLALGSHIRFVDGNRVIEIFDPERIGD